MPRLKIPEFMKEAYQPPDPDMTPTMWRWILFWNILSYAVLLLITMQMLFNSDLNWPPQVLAMPLSWPLKLVCLAGSLLYGVWYWYFVVLYDRWINKEQIKAVSFAAAILLCFGLSWLHPVYFFLLFNLFGVAFGVLPMVYAVPVNLFIGVNLMARLILPVGIYRETFWEAFWVIPYIFGAIILGLWVRAMVKQAQESQKMEDELAFTQGALAREQRESGILAERQRLAGVIHDTLAQDLASIVMHLEAAEQALETDPAVVQTHLVKARRTAREGLTEARRFVWALQPEVAKQEPLPDAVQRISEGWGLDNGIKVQFNQEGTAAVLHPTLEVTILRAVQEALANIHKHARADRVNITLTYMRDEVWLDVQDNGSGFNPNELGKPDAETGGYGLYALRERALDLQGQLVIESEPGEGTTLVLQLPLLAQDKVGEAREDGEEA